MTAEETIAAAVLAGATAIGTAIKWIGGRITRALERNSDAMVENTKSNAVLSTQVQTIALFVQQQAKPAPAATSATAELAAVDLEIEDEVTTTTVVKKTRTPARGTALPAERRATTHGGDS